MENYANEQTAVQVVTGPIGTEQVRKAMETLRKYKKGKANLEKRLIDNEQYWRMRHWEQYRTGNDGDPKPVSGWLVNVILNRHADAMDAFPEAICLPRARDDEEEAKKLTKILPVILKQTRFVKAYSEAMYDKIKFGTGVYGVFWNNNALHGLGDISVRRLSLLNLFWEPGVEDIQDSRDLFITEMVSNDLLEHQYPQLAGKLKSGTQDVTVSSFQTEDHVDNTDKSLVVSWYYHRGDVLHYCRFCGDTVLFATENDPEFAENGWYDHGKYPVVLDVLYPEQDTPCGFGFVDVCKDPQKYVDVLNQAILKNTVAAATPRFFIRSDGSVNEQEFADWSKPFIHVDGQLGQDSILPVQVANLPASALNVLELKTQEMRQTSGNTESATGVASSAVTAASAIAALQEASGKLSRDMNKHSFSAFEDIILMCIELIRQFYDLPRTFRITGETGEMEFTQYDNSHIKPVEQSLAGVDTGWRTPEFDIEVVPQSESRYTKAEYNQLAMSLYSAGFFTPEAAPQALMALSMMDFKGKDKVEQQIRTNGDLAMQVKALQQQIVQMAAIIDAQNGSDLSAQFAAGQGSGAPAAVRGGTVSQVPEMEGDGYGESTVTAKARAQSQMSTQPQ